MSAGPDLEHGERTPTGLPVIDRDGEEGAIGRR
ncbi:MAG: hypothetical protein KatS3mg111_2400 [Pirellulaceae bacterium]|nr:MAG: hypothetical protein KatS3mg111_2400 [Pirellulaceae bacterium]